LLSLVAIPRPAWGLPEDPGPLQIQQLTRKETIGGKSVSFDLYVPATTTKCPMIALGHGFMRSRVMLREWGKLLASRGYVAAAPDFGLGSSDHVGNSKVLLGLLDWMESQGNQPGSVLANRVDGSRRGVMGHSAGGLAALLAASTDPKVDVVVGLDPVDVSALGQTAAPLIKVPVTILRAVPAQCNSSGNAAAMVVALGGPAFTLQVLKATHCDPEWPSDPACGLLCGGDDAIRRSRFVRYAMATLDHVLLCDPTAAPYLGGAPAAADTLVADIGQKAFPMPQLGCAAPPDAGVDGQGPDGGSPWDGADLDGPTADLGTVADAVVSDPTVDDSGCECRMAARPAAGVWPVLLGLLGLLFRRR